MVVVLTSQLSNGLATMTHLCGACNGSQALLAFRYNAAAARIERVRL